jgi:argininosuccinate lyase
MKPCQSAFDDVHHALADVVQALGGFKRVGTRLWPEKSPDSAGRYLADCLNSSRLEKLSLEHVLLLLRLGREANCHAAMHYICGETGYVPAVPVTPCHEMAALQSEFIEQVKHLDRLVQRIDEVMEGQK